MSAREEAAYILRSLAMPLQLPSLLFVVLMALFYSLASLALSAPYLWILPTCIVTFWTAKYAFAMLERASDGRPEAPVVEADMLGPFGGPGPAIHLLLAFAIYQLADWLGGLSSRVLVAVALALLPASVGVLGATQHLAEALNPFALLRVVRALGRYYVLILLVIGIYALAAAALESLPGSPQLRHGLEEILVLSAYCVIGGSLYLRRASLGLDPRTTPERSHAKARDERARDRQRQLDAIYAPLRARQYGLALAAVKIFMDGADPTQLPDEVRLMLSRAAKWNDPRGLAELTHAAVGELIRRNELSLALAVLDDVCRELPDFALDTEAASIVLARHARLVGRRGFGLVLLDRFAGAVPGRTLSRAAAELRAELAG